MELLRLNPFVRSAALYEKINRSDECVSYDCRLIYVVSGDLSATVGGAKLGHLTAGHLLFIPAGVPYKLKSKYLRAVVIGFDLSPEAACRENVGPVPVGEFNSELSGADVFPPFDRMIHIPDMEAERDGLVALTHRFTSGEGFYRDELSARVKLLLLKLAELSDEHALPSRMVEALDSYIRENVGDEISNTEIGAIFGYHPFYVSRMLKEKKGVTLRQYIIAYRLKAAARLLELSDKSVNEIAEECGFTDASYFTKTFKSAYGETPKAYRNRFKDDFI